MCQSTKGRDDTRCVAALCYLWRKDTWLNSLVGEGQEIDGVWQEPEMRLFVELILDGQTVVDADRWLEEFSSEVADASKRKTPGSDGGNREPVTIRFCPF